MKHSATKTEITACRDAIQTVKNDLAALKENRRQADLDEAAASSFEQESAARIQNFSPRRAEDVRQFATDQAERKLWELFLSGAARRRCAIQRKLVADLKGLAETLWQISDYYEQPRLTSDALLPFLGEGTAENIAPRVLLVAESILCLRLPAHAPVAEVAGANVAQREYQYSQLLANARPA